MNETQKKLESKRKLALHRETLQTLGEGELQALEGVVGGTNPKFDLWGAYTQEQ